MSRTQATTVYKSAIGLTVLGQVAPDSTYLKANGQTLSQATYPTLYSQVGITPSFTPSVKTVLPTSLTDVAYSSSLGLYVGVSNGPSNIWVSTDLTNWNAIVTTGLIVGSDSSIVWASTIGKFLITTTNSNYVHTSVDGYNWVISQVFADSSSLVFAAASPTTFVVAGASDLDNSIVNLWTSTDGVTWTRRAMAGTAAITVTALHYSAGMSMFVLGGSLGQIQTSPTGTTWTSQTSNIASQINAFDSYASLMVAVGAAGVISSSINGTVWVARTNQTASALTGVAYSPTATIPWVAVGSNIVMNSTNGTTWKTLGASFSTNTRGNIFYGNSLYVGGGVADWVETSPDLISWTGRVPATGGMLTNAMNAGAYGNSAYVLVGAAGKIDESADGTTWTNQTANAGANALNHVIYAAGTVNLFIAVGAGNIINTSPQGTAWTAQTSNVVSTLAAVAFDPVGNVAVAVGSGGQISSSANGTTWASRTSNTGLALRGVAWNGTIFTVVGTGVVLTSTNGTTWIKQSPTLIGTQQINWITSDGTYFYAIVINNNSIYISSDGINWSAYSCPIFLTSINWMNNQLVAYAGAGDIATSPDGKTWTVQSLGKSTTFAKAYWLNSNFIALNNGAGLFKSSDGIIFNGLTATVANGIAYSASQDKLVMVGADGLIMTSTDTGTTWTPNYSFSINSSLPLSDITYSPSLDLFVAVGSNSMIISSPDGITWTQRPYLSIHTGDLPAGSLSYIVWSVDKAIFVATGGIGEIITSTDGINWTERTSGTEATLNQTAYNSSLGMFVAVGNQGNIVTSTNGTSWTSRPTGFPTAFLSVATLESLGFVAMSNTGQTYLSTDGITWNHKNGVVVTNNAPGKAIYSSVDKTAFFPFSNINVSPTSGLFGTNDGLTFEWYFANSNGISSTNLGAVTYDSVADKYIVVGSNGTPTSLWVAIFSRTYNKSTQFALPVLKDTFIKVQ